MSDLHRERIEGRWATVAYLSAFVDGTVMDPATAPVAIVRFDNGEMRYLTFDPPEPTQLTYREKLALQLREWDESKHPRDQGKFSESDGAGAATGFPSDHYHPPKTKRQAHKERVAKAKATYKPMTSARNQLAKKSERQLAQMAGGKGTPDNAPADVKALDVNGHRHGVEVKTFIDNTNDKVTVHPSSRRRKEEWAKESKSKLHLVVFDRRKPPLYSGHLVYYHVGVGAFRLSTMTPVRDAAHLRKLMRES